MMKRFVRFLCIPLICLLLLPLLGAGAAFAADGRATDGSEARYTRKTVVVLYDDSGSMSMDNRSQYALYAMQMLMGLMDSGDRMTVYTMNHQKSISVNLSAASREAEITRILEGEKNSAFRPDGTTTPFDSVDAATKLLVDAGMKTKAQTGTEVDNTNEYWLIVLTDGAFYDGSSQVSRDKLKNKLIQNTDTYSNFRTVYFGMGQDAMDLSGTGTATFSPFRAGTAAQIAAGMQEVAKRLSGRYALDSSAYTVSGNTVRVDLSTLPCAFRSISVIAQNCDATLLSADHDGRSVPLSLPVTIKPDAALKMKNGFSAVLRETPYFKGGVLTLTFSGPVNPDALTVLMEPALSITPYYLRQEGGKWVEADASYLSNYMKPGDIVRVGYRVQEASTPGRDIDLAAVFGKTESTVYYNGRTYAVGQDISLVEGANEIGLTVSIMDGAYTLSATVPCVILKDPTSYYISAKTEQDGENPGRYTTSFTIYVDGKPLPAASFSRYRITLTEKDAAGQDTPAGYSVQGNALVCVSDFGSGFGQRTLTLKVLDEHSIARQATEQVLHYPAALSLTVTGRDSLSLSEAALRGNRQAFSFTLTADGRALDFTNPFCRYTVTLDGQDVTSCVTVSGNTLTLCPDENTPGAAVPGDHTVTVSVAGDRVGLQASASVALRISPAAYAVAVTGPQRLDKTPHTLTSRPEGFTFTLTESGAPVDFASPLLRYTVLVGSVDVTAYVTVSGNTLQYIPAPDHFPGGVPQGESAVTVTVYGATDSVARASATATLSLSPSAYTITPLPAANTTADRFALDKTDACLRFRVTRDGEPLTGAELEQALADGSVQVQDGGIGFFLFPCGLASSAAEENGEGILLLQVVQDQPAFFAFFTSLLIPSGERKVSVGLGNAVSEGALSFTPSPLPGYLLRILLFVLIVYVLVFLILTPSRKRHEKRQWVTITVSKTTGAAIKKPKKVNCTLTDRLIFGRLVPVVGLFRNQKEVKMGGKLSLAFKNGRDCVTKSGSGELYHLKPTDAIPECSAQLTKIRNAAKEHKNITTLADNGNLKTLWAQSFSVKGKPWDMSEEVSYDDYYVLFTKSGNEYIVEQITFAVDV